jgi:sugar lactone lactonase YvrE
MNEMKEEPLTQRRMSRRRRGSSVFRRLGAGLVFLASTAAQAAPGSVTLAGERVFPESVTVTADGTLYAGSFASGGVFRVKPGSAEAEPWIAPGAFGTRSILGVLADEKAGLLWVCSNDLSARGVPGPGDARGSWLKGFDLKTGAGRVSARFPGERNFCNDIAVGPDGAVYVTNSLQPQILRLDRRRNRLEVWLSDPAFAPPAKGSGLDGIVFGPDGDLYLDTFAEAKLFRVAVKDGKPQKVVTLTPSRPLVLADALRPLNGKDFLLVEGGGRLDRVTFTANGATVTTLREGLNGPTGVALKDGIAFVSEGQLARLFDKDNPTPVLPFRLVAVPVE